MFADARRGDIWMVDIPAVPIGEELSRTIFGYRPVLVISSNTTNMDKVLATVAPMTTRMYHADGKMRVPLLPDGYNSLDKPSLVLADQITTIDQRKLARWVGCVKAEDMARVEDAIKYALGL